METFIDPRGLINNPHYEEQRQRSLNGINLNEIDIPVIKIVKDFNKLPYCFTLQSCYGHFLYKGQKDSDNIEKLPASKNISLAVYRIAYVALCIQNSKQGRVLYHDLKEITSIAPEYIQFGSAEWFWNRQVNSYALQVEPENSKTKDRINVDFNEALIIERVRDSFFAHLKILLKNHIKNSAQGKLN